MEIIFNILGIHRGARCAWIWNSWFMIHLDGQIREMMFADGLWVSQELIDILLLGVICKLKLSVKLKVSLRRRANAKTLIYIPPLCRDIMIDRERQISPYNIKCYRKLLELVLMQHKRNLNENFFIFNEYFLIGEKSSSNLLTSMNY